MASSVAMRVEVPGLRIEYEGGEGTCREILSEVLGPVARGSWRASGPPLAVEPVIPQADAPGRSPAGIPEHPAPSAGSAPAAAPAPAPSSPAREGSSRPVEFDPARLLARLVAEGGRRSEKDAVLLALVALGSEGRRDATPAEILAHLEARGYAARDLKPRPILAKLSLRKGLVAPGVLPNTFRATPAGSAYIWKRAAGA